MRARGLGRHKAGGGRRCERIGCAWRLHGNRGSGNAAQRAHRAPAANAERLGIPCLAALVGRSHSGRGRAGRCRFSACRFPPLRPRHRPAAVGKCIAGADNVQRTGARHVDKVYRPRGKAPVTAVKDLNLDIRPSEIAALLGSSGCGKTSTLRMIAASRTFRAAQSGSTAAPFTACRRQSVASRWPSRPIHSIRRSPSARISPSR